MKKTTVLLTGIAAVLVLAVTMPAQAAEEGAGKKAVTITGTGTCAKCALKETDSCQNVIQTEENGKKVTYYLTKNDVSKEFHTNICQGPKKVKATGTVKEANGKKELTVTKIALADKD